MTYGLTRVQTGSTKKLVNFSMDATWDSVFDLHKSPVTLSVNHLQVTSAALQNSSSSTPFPSSALHSAQDPTRRERSRQTSFPSLTEYDTKSMGFLPLLSSSGVLL